MKTLIYLRQSLASDELAVQRQEEACRALCEQRGYDVVCVLTDNNVSASRGVRPAYQELLQSLERREADVVVVYRLDRLLRKLTELETLIELSERTGITIVTVQGDLDISNAQGRLLGRILASVARSEVETKSERHKLANAQRAAMGKPHGSRRPYGYEADLVTIYEPEAAALREMANKVIAGWGFNETARWTVKQGHLTTTGRPFNGLTVRNMLLKPRYGGIREYNGVQYKASWLAVFDETMYEQLQLTMKLRSERNVPKSRKFLLTGLLVCGACGGHMNGTRKRDRKDAPMRRIYICVDCRSVRRNADALDWYVREQVIDRLDSPEMAKLLSPGQGSELQALFEERQRRRQRLDQLVEDYGAGLLDRSQFARAKATAEALLAETQSSLDTTIRGTHGLAIGHLSPGDTIRTAWEQTDSTEWKRQLLELVIKQVVVNRELRKPLIEVDGHLMRFCPEGVEIRYQDS